MAEETNKEELYRRLAQARRMIAEPLDPVTKGRLQALAIDLQTQLAAVEARDADVPE